MGRGSPKDWCEWVSADAGCEANPGFAVRKFRSSFLIHKYGRNLCHRALDFDGLKSLCGGAQSVSAMV